MALMPGTYGKSKVVENIKETLKINSASDENYKKITDHCLI